MGFVRPGGLYLGGTGRRNRYGASGHTYENPETRAARIIQQAWREKKNEFLGDQADERYKLERTEMKERVAHTEALAIATTNLGFLRALQHCLQSGITQRNPAAIKDNHGNNLLMLAVMSGSVDTFDYLLSLNNGDNHFVAFQSKAANDDGKTVQDLINTRDETSRALFQTALNNTTMFGQAKNKAEELKKAAEEKVAEVLKTAKQKTDCRVCC